MQASSTRGVLIMSGHNMDGKGFEIAHFILGILIIYRVTAATWVTPPTFIENNASSIINYFSIGISNFGSLVLSGSISFRSRGLWILFIYWAFAWLLWKGAVLLEATFLVVQETINYTQVPRFAILRSIISTCLPPFMGFHQIVHGHLEEIQTTLHFYLLDLIRNT